MDDICVHSLFRGEYIEHLQKVFEKCKTYKIFLKLEKCVFIVRQGIILEHVFKNNISTNLDKIKTIIETPRPMNVKRSTILHGTLQLL